MEKPWNRQFLTDLHAGTKLTKVVPSCCNQGQQGCAFMLVPSSPSLFLDWNWLHRLLLEGKIPLPVCSIPWRKYCTCRSHPCKTSWTRLGYGQISIETVTHSFRQRWRSGVFVLCVCNGTCSVYIHLAYCTLNKEKIEGCSWGSFSMHQHAVFKSLP